MERQASSPVRKQLSILSSTRSRIWRVSLVNEKCNVLDSARADLVKNFTHSPVLSSHIGASVDFPLCAPSYSFENSRRQPFRGKLLISKPHIAGAHHGDDHRVLPVGCFHQNGMSNFRQIRTGPPGKIAGQHRHCHKHCQQSHLNAQERRHVECRRSASATAAVFSPPMTSRTPFLAIVCADFNLPPSSRR
jgi:hypothetical protein